jgi:CheY-like chemotaxis protein
MSRHILIVDDNPAIRATISEVLAEEGYTVASATNSAEGLAALARALPAMRMPVLDGWGFASALKERGVSLPIVVMTAAQDARRWSEEIGASSVLAKPFDLDELVQAAERALQKRPTV